jgi:hypothetical protein
LPAIFTPRIGKVTWPSSILNPATICQFRFEDALPLRDNSGMNDLGIFS